MYSDAVKIQLIHCLKVGNGYTFCLNVFCIILYSLIDKRDVTFINFFRFT